jgi:xyloglucan-specific endo-beta-1,4-glucanase
MRKSLSRTGAALAATTLLSACGGSTTGPSSSPTTGPTASATPEANPTPYAAPPAGYDNMISSDYQMILFDKYMILNNLFGKNSAQPGWWSQMFYQSGTSKWGARWNFQTDTAHQWAVKAFPSIVVGWQWGDYSPDSPLGVRVGTPVETRWSVTSTGRGRYDVAYDLWLHGIPRPGGNDNPTDEIMIWLDSYNISPTGKKMTSTPVTISGYPWNVYYGPQATGSWDYIAFDSPTKLRSVSLNLKDFTDYCVAQGWMSGREYLTSVEAGVEVWYGQDQLDTTEYSVTVP